MDNGITRSRIVLLLVVGLPLSADRAVGQTLLGASRRTVAKRQAVGRAAEGSLRAVSGSRRADSTSLAGSLSDWPAADREALAWQTALERAGFSPGIIDGIVGPKTRAALVAYQSGIGASMTGRFDAGVREALGVDATPLTRQYTLMEADLAQVGRCPTDWIAKSKARRLGFDSLSSVAAHYGHCSERLLAKLNPRLDLDSLKPGDVVVLPNVVPVGAPPKAAGIEIDFGTRTIRAFDRSDRLVGLFHCSIAKEKANRPNGVCRVKCIAMNPKYLFKPESWPEVKGIDQRLVIPPGPRNPVGLCWIGLSLKGYGIHGTPEPELIGKTGSHGCIRLTNWHVLRLAEMVDVGTEVRFVDSTARVARRG